MRNTLKWIDGHCHLADPRFEGLLPEVLKRSQAAQVHGWIQGGTCPEDWDRQKQLRSKWGPGVILTFGIHPWWVAKMVTDSGALPPSSTPSSKFDAQFTQLENRIEEAAGLGELGLDFSERHCPVESHDLQKTAFEAQIQLAQKARKPLILHIVRAHSEALTFLQKHAPFPSGGMVHLFSGSAEIAREYLQLGLHISFGGSIVKEGFKKIKKAIQSVPLERMIIETDSPDQLPMLLGVEPNSLNEPANLIKIAEFLAQELQLDRDLLLSQSTNNLLGLFKLTWE